MFSARALSQLCGRLQQEPLEQLGASLGEEAAAALKKRRPETNSLATEEVAEELGGELSLCGLGSLSLERWGEALVARVEGCPLGAGSGPVVGAYLQKAVRALWSDAACVVPVESSGQSLRYLFCSAPAAERVRKSLQSGKGFADSIAALQGAGGAHG